MSNDVQKLPASGPEREALREKGQFWTPAWVAEAMVGYVLSDRGNILFDPAVGAGAFFHAAKAIARETGRAIRLMGAEIDPDALQQARASGLSDDDLANVQITDFVLQPPDDFYRAIVANPPYIRHHRLTGQVKTALRSFSQELIGATLDGRAGLHIYFLIRALQLLEWEGRLAFIMPADTCEGIFAPTLWDWITRNYCLEAVITFAPEISPFPGVDTNPLIFMIRNARPKETFLWAKCTEAGSQALKVWASSEFKEPPGRGVLAAQRQLSEGLATGLSRPPSPSTAGDFSLADFARVLRGIATGANEFFFLTSPQVRELEIPDEFLIRAIGRTRDVVGDQVDGDTLTALDRKGRPTFLFSPDGRRQEQFPEAVRRYLEWGEAQGIHTRKLILTRNPWYKMETRTVPPILFAYLGRRNARFIRNLAGIVPLTGFLCIYPRNDDPIFIEKLWQVLRHPETIANLVLVGKSYGEGAIKVEPRALERLRLPVSVVSQAGLQPEAVQKQLYLF